MTACFFLHLQVASSDGVQIGLAPRHPGAPTPRRQLRRRTTRDRHARHTQGCRQGQDVLVRTAVVRRTRRRVGRFDRFGASRRGNRGGGGARVHRQTSRRNVRAVRPDGAQGRRRVERGVPVAQRDQGQGQLRGVSGDDGGFVRVAIVRVPGGFLRGFGGTRVRVRVGVPEQADARDAHHAALRAV